MKTTLLFVSFMFLATFANAESLYESHYKADRIEKDRESVIPSVKPTQDEKKAVAQKFRDLVAQQDLEKEEAEKAENEESRVIEFLSYEAGTDLGAEVVDSK